MPFKIVEETIEYITRSPHQLDFLMQICHHETEPESSRLWLSGVTVGGGYFCGGITSLLPYFWSRNVFEGLVTSICIMSVALLLFGYSKTCLISGWSGRQNIRLGVLGAVEMLFVGGCAVGAAYGLVVIANKLGGLD
jgi:VIT1/CCC1 family predicted Fe2+/Mn2+ transporter